MVEWDITEPLPFDIGGRTDQDDAVFRITGNPADVAIGNLPFLLSVSDETPYERAPGQTQKDQFDADRVVGEQSLAGWWLRSQSDFAGGAGITYREPILGEGSENRFIDSRGVDVFSEDAVRLLHRMEVVQSGAGDDLEAVGIGLGRTLYRDGGDFWIIDESSVTSVTPNGTNPQGIARIPDSSWVVGHDAGISRVRDSGTVSDVITGASRPLRPYWVKDRIFAAQEERILQLTLDAGDISADEDGYVVHQNPSNAWRWVGIAETPGAVWAAGGANSRSHVVAFTVDAQGELPTVEGAPVRIEMPLGERITCLEAYSDLLLIGTTEGFRIAATDGDQAELGPLLWGDEQAHSITARWGYAWVGVSGGLTRKINLGVQTGEGLRFAWAHDAQLDEGGDVLGLGWVWGQLVVAAANTGAARQHKTELVGFGYIDIGFSRWGVLEDKIVRSAMILGDVSAGSMGISTATSRDAYAPVATLGGWSGSKEVDLHLRHPVTKISIQLQLNRDNLDPTSGPQFEGYQLRALPAPRKKHTLIRLPLKLYDQEMAPSGAKMGGKGFAWARLRELERLERRSAPVLYRDFRTGESRTVIVESTEHIGLASPIRTNSNFGGVVLATLRTID
ncbi:hypothetical protein [Phytoactinopolyspora halophila]|uniref:hypothetical protein n=1 Tax=Phytoactinopolyspora halophila TaxID=1981511 RepID=UPI000F4D6B82|nr:hypothetical protein [Phytoactinopolyspora halophila]